MSASVADIAEGYRLQHSPHFDHVRPETARTGLRYRSQFKTREYQQVMAQERKGRWSLTGSVISFFIVEHSNLTLYGIFKQSET